MPSTDATENPLLRIGHSPDPDDAFMWFPLTGIDGGPPLIDTGRFRFEAVQLDIETLNQRADDVADLEITAISIAQYPHVADRYALTSCGSSMGDGYGPKLVAREPIDLADLLSGRLSLAIPGERTSALLATGLMLGGRPERAVMVPFEEIPDRVQAGEFDAGLVIHEGQLTFEQFGLVLIADLGAWWKEHTNLPLPLGGNAIRRDLEDLHGPGTPAEVTAILLASLQYALEHRDEAIDYALRFGRGLERSLAEQFVSMYVNKLTLDYGETGREAVRRFLTEAAEAGLVPPCERFDFVSPAG